MWHFDDFTEEEIKRFEDYDFEFDGEGLHHLDCDFTVYKMNDQYYVEREEAEGCLQEMNGNYYVLAPTWYMHFDIESFIENYDKCLVDPETFDIEGYWL